MTLKIFDTVLKINFALLLMISVMLACGCQRGSDSLVLTEADNGKDVILKKGDLFKLRLKSQLSTGYSWKIVNYNKDIMIIGKPEIETLKKDVVGGIDYQIFSIEARDSGEGGIVLHYLQPWQRVAQPEKTYEINVRVE